MANATELIAARGLAPTSIKHQCLKAGGIAGLVRVAPARKQGCPTSATSVKGGAPVLRPLPSLTGARGVQAHQGARSQRVMEMCARREACTCLARYAAQNENSVLVCSQPRSGLGAERSTSCHSRQPGRTVQ